MLSNEKIMDLITQAQSGDIGAKEVLLTENLNLVRSIVHRFTNRGYEWDDLFQIGCMGMVKAIERFDLSFNVKFSTYAVPMIIGEIRRFIRDDNPIKVSRPIKDIAYKVHKVQEFLRGSLGHEPTIQEIAEKSELSTQEIISALDAMQPIVSLYEATTNNSGDQLLLLDQIASTNDEIDCLEKITLNEVIDRLSEKERYVIRMRFYEDKTQSEIANQIGLSQVQISRIEKQALKKIKNFL
ncbi:MULTISPECIES: SigF/SigG family RNA polymerase sporulation sigma factor [Anaerosinus]|uniref:SigF/SigG family RNA polymerase sporulation sigma factor n=1 Tax=Selenobaculum gibii TaxID=3054208 RepID=A0A9Y2AH36_9FIRM|nr:SigF/SigG family RNA polymerase sporulation sigma factor [Selenobaculum gbiensis]WIW69651.1 SigF/SigG family RNA polymerase sporulation sigma factor [Selenobaculum gbiensis]